MEWKLNDERKNQYDNMLKVAQDLETTIGSSDYRLHKLLKMRDDVDVSLKSWWEEIIKEMNLESARDYMITRDGTIKDITKPKPGQTELNTSTLGTNAAELK